jgi:Winged helix DNA-binding domain
VLVNGAVAGVWEHERTGSRIEVTIHPLRKFAAAQKKQIHEEADRLGRFLEAPATVSSGG